MSATNDMFGNFLAANVGVTLISPFQLDISSTISNFLTEDVVRNRKGIFLLKDSTRQSLVNKYYQDTSLILPETILFSSDALKSDVNIPIINEITKYLSIIFIEWDGAFPTSPTYMAISNRNHNCKVVLFYRGWNGVSLIGETEIQLINYLVNLSTESSKFVNSFIVRFGNYFVVPSTVSFDNPLTPIMTRMERSFESIGLERSMTKKDSLTRNIIQRTKGKTLVICSTTEQLNYVINDLSKVPKLPQFQVLTEQNIQNVNMNLNFITTTSVLQNINFYVPNIDYVDILDENISSNYEAFVYFVSILINLRTNPTRTVYPLSIAVYGASTQFRVTYETFVKIWNQAIVDTKRIDKVGGNLEISF